MPKGFLNSWNVGLEEFSQPAHLPRMDSTWGNKGEYWMIAALFLLAPLVTRSRKSNESGMAAQVHSCNSYSEIRAESSKKPTEWS
jgi:hypothetical protein